MNTVLITGATEGIGYEFSLLYAQKQYNLILVARNEQKLQSMCHKFSQSGINCSYFAADLSDIEQTKKLYTDIKKRGQPIQILINNAGFGHHGESIYTEWETEEKMYMLNMISLAYLTKHFAKEMAENGFGRILNVASVAAFQPLPYMAAYAATKAFVLNLSMAINEEVIKKNVLVSTLCPGVTESKFHATAKTENKLLKKGFFPIATAKEVAEYGIKLTEKRKSFGVYGLFNKIQIFLLRLMPRQIIIKMVAKIMK